MVICKLTNVALPCQSSIILALASLNLGVNVGYCLLVAMGVGKQFRDRMTHNFQFLVDKTYI